MAQSVAQEAKQYYRGLKIRPDDVSGVPSKNVMVLLMYTIMRERGATDLGLGKPSKIQEIGLLRDQLHHIFPFNYMMTNQEAKRFAERMEYTPSEFREEVNDIANLTFVSRTKNAEISDDSPLEYLENETNAAMRKAHFIPEDRELWKVENFDKFLCGAS